MPACPTPPSIPSPIRRKLLGAGCCTLATALAGCGNSPAARTLGLTWEQHFGGDPFTLEQVAQNPYATLAARIGNSPRAMIVLGRVDGENLHWVAADKGILVTRHGRVVQTARLATGNLIGTQLLHTDPLAPTGQWRHARRWQRVIDLQPGYRFGLKVNAEWLPSGEVEIRTIRGTQTAFLVKELCEVDGKSYLNQFWLSPTDGHVVKSEQYLCPDWPPIALETLKPYAPAPTT